MDGEKQIYKKVLTGDSEEKRKKVLILQWWIACLIITLLKRKEEEFNHHTKELKLYHGQSQRMSVGQFVQFEFAFVKQCLSVSERWLDEKMSLSLHCCWCHWCCGRQTWHPLCTTTDWLMCSFTEQKYFWINTDLKIKWVAFSQYYTMLLFVSTVCSNPGPFCVESTQKAPPPLSLWPRARDNQW